ncbi:MAG: peptidoglycan-associated lipoprotein Pal [Burkholderiaceae bacterium]
MNLRLLICSGLTATLIGCGSSVKLDDNPARIESRGGAQAGTAAGGAQSAGIGGAGSTTNRDVAQIQAATPSDPLEEPNSLLSQRSIFFDYDSFTIREEFQGLVEAHARYLTANPERQVVLQGNTDERGAREYNLALGQKRAEAVRRAMAVLGVSDNQVEAVSFGEERPRNFGSSEADMAENRRVDIVYK